MGGGGGERAEVDGGSIIITYLTLASVRTDGPRRPRVQNGRGQTLPTSKDGYPQSQGPVVDGVPFTSFVQATYQSTTLFVADTYVSAIEANRHKQHQNGRQRMTPPIDAHGRRARAMGAQVNTNASVRPFAFLPRHAPSSTRIEAAVCFCCREKPFSHPLPHAKPLLQVLELTNELRALQTQPAHPFTLPNHMVPHIIMDAHTLISSTKGGTIVTLPLNYLDPDQAPYTILCDDMLLPCIITDQRCALAGGFRGGSSVFMTGTWRVCHIGQASFIRAILQGGAGGLGGWVFSRVGGSKALDPPPPLIILRVSWVGLLPHLLSLVTGALSGCLLVPLSVVSLCRWQVCSSYGYSNPMGYQTSDFRLLWAITPNPNPPSPPC